MGIKISKLPEDLQALAKLADNNYNGKIDKDEENIFEKLKEDRAQETDFREIFGSTIKAQTTTPESVDLTTTDSKKEIKQKQAFLLRALKEEMSADSNDILKALTERIGESNNDPTYINLVNDVKEIMNAIDAKKCSSKEEIEDLEQEIKNELDIKKKDNFEKDVLELLVAREEAIQKDKEYKEMQTAYDKKVAAGMDEEQAYKEMKADFKEKDSYYKDYLDRDFLEKMSEFEKKYIMPKQREIVREAIYQTQNTSSKDVKKAAKAILIRNKDWNKYTKKALNGENSFGARVSGLDSDMKVIRKNHARWNKIEDIREDGISEEDMHKKLDKRKTFLFFKKKTELFEAIKNSGMVTQRDDGNYDVSKLSLAIAPLVGTDALVNKQSNDFVAISETLKTTSGLAVLTELKSLNEGEAKQLVKLCGYPKQGENWFGKFQKALAEALKVGAATAGSVYTNGDQTYMFNDINTLDQKLTISCDADIAEQVKNGIKTDIKGTFENSEKIKKAINTTDFGIEILINIKDIKPYIIHASKHAIETFAKSALFGAGIGFITSGNSRVEKPVISTNMTSNTLEDYKTELMNEAPKLHLSNEQISTILFVAGAFANEDGSWNKEGYRNFLENTLAGTGGVVNREELLGARRNFEKKNDSAKETEQNKKYTPNFIGTADKITTKTEQYDLNTKTIDGRRASWNTIVNLYDDCLVKDFGYKMAVRMIKIAQAITNGDYSQDNLVKLANLSFASKDNKYENMKNIEGLDHKVLEQTINADWLGSSIKVPDKLAGCDRHDKDVTAKKANTEGAKEAPVNSAKDTGTRETKTGKYAVRFNNGEVESFDNIEDRNNRVAEFKKKYPKASVITYNSIDELSK